MKKIKGYFVKANYTCYFFPLLEVDRAVKFANTAAIMMDETNVDVSIQIITEDEPCTTATNAATDSTSL